ncbi:MAG: ABC transporter substrate-binding protein [Rhodobacteraceae bacterium]|nr:ABC transporter substrate-binding protein [Paracoccaceae bacterium]
MTLKLRQSLSIVAQVATILGFSCSLTLSEPSHGIAMYGTPALESGFSSLPYVNPGAPKGGKLVLGESGGFDSLNPFIQKGRAPWGVRSHVFESLLGRSWDEPFSLYGLLAESVDTGPDRDWVEFVLRSEARFSDGSPVTVDDVLWSFETLGTKGNARYLNAWRKIETAEQTGPRSVRFTFNTADRELPLILGLRPILRKADWEGRDFAESGLEVPNGSGPYVIGNFEANRTISFLRNPDYWGRELAFNLGRHNFNEIRYDYFTDGSVIFEAFKAGELSLYREWNAARWTDYDFPSLKSGAVVKSEIPHQRPSGIKGFVMNTRNPLFADWRVREALIYAFNFEFISRALNGGEQPRISSYFSNSALSMTNGPAEGRVRELLAPFADGLLPGALDGYALPESDGSERNRRNLRHATKLLKEAGWSVQEGVLRNSTGKAFEFEVLLKAASTENEAIINIYIDSLKRLGIKAAITQIDSVQHKERMTDYDFDMAFFHRLLSLSPGNEQLLYWGAEGVTRPGTRNYMGMNSPAAEAMIDTMLNARGQQDFVAAVRALDRILITGRYVIPIWHATRSNIAHKKELKYPEQIPMYGDWLGFLPDVWWYQE